MADIAFVDSAIADRRTAYRICIGSDANSWRIAKSMGDEAKMAHYARRIKLLAWARDIMDLYPLSTETCNGQYIPDPDIVCCAMRLADPCCAHCHCAPTPQPPPFDCTIVPDFTGIAEDAAFEPSAAAGVSYFIVSDDASSGNSWASNVGSMVVDTTFTAVGELQVVEDPGTSILWTIGGGAPGHYLPVVDMLIMVGGDYVLTSRYPNVNAARTWNIQIEGSVDGTTWVPLYTGPETVLADPLLVTAIEGLLQVRTFYRFGLCNYGPEVGSVTLGPFFSFVSTDTTSIDFILRSTTGYVTVELWDGTQAQYGAGNPAADIVISLPVPGTGPYSGTAPKTVTAWSILNGTLIAASGNLTKFTIDGQSVSSVNNLREPGFLEYRANNNNLTTLVFAPTSNLQVVSASNNDIATFSIDSNALTSLAIHQNNLTTCVVTGCEATLSTFFCHQNQLTTLTVAGFTVLTDFRCFQNQLTSLDVTGCASITNMLCGVNQLTTLDVSTVINVVTLDCTNNDLTTLNVSTNVDLVTLNCGTNQLSALVLTTNTLLQTVDCSFNLLTALVTTPNIALVTLNCNNNSITSLALGTNTALVSLRAQVNQLATLTVSANTLLQTLLCYQNFLTALNVASNTALRTLDCSNNDITGLSLTTNTLLLSLTCSGNPISTLDISTNTALTTCIAAGCGLSAFDPTNNPALTIVNVETNSITPSIDFSANNLLANVRIGENLLTGTVDVSGKNNLIAFLMQTNPSVTTVLCNDCSLVALYIFGCTGITTLDASNNALPQLGAFGIDQIFQPLSVAAPGTANCSGGTNAAPSSASLAKRNALISSGWTITTN
jgi:hypothetical protein